MISIEYEIQTLAVLYLCLYEAHHARIQSLSWPTMEELASRWLKIARRWGPSSGTVRSSSGIGQDRHDRENTNPEDTLGFFSGLV